MTKPGSWLGNVGCTWGLCPGSVQTRPKNNGCAAKLSDPSSVVPESPPEQACRRLILAATYTDMIVLCHPPQSARSTIVFMSDLQPKQPNLPLFYR